MESAGRGRAHWITVASAEHVRRGRKEGFIQVCHGKLQPLSRIRPGDGVICYSPTLEFRGKTPCRSFTAIGQIRDRDPYAVDMDEGFRPFRRDVDWLDAAETPIRPLLAELDFARAGPNWGWQMRFGMFRVTERDFQTIRHAMCSAA